MSTRGPEAEPALVSLSWVAMRAVCLGWIVVCGVGLGSVDAQTAYGVGGLQNDEGQAIAMDAAGNTYVTGSFNGTVDFDPGPGTLDLAAVGTEATFVASYTASGALRYALAIPGNNGSFYPGGIAVDASGNVYVTGVFSGAAVDFDPGAGEELLDAREGRVFVASYDAGGALRWAFNVGGAESRVEVGTGIALDASGNVYVTGTFNGTEDFDPDAESTQLVAGVTDVFLASYTNGGDYRFAISVGGDLADFGWDLAVDAAGNSVLTGSFQGTADFDPGAGETLLTSEGGEDIFVAGYDPTGLLRFALSVGTSGTGTIDRGLAVALNGSGDVFVTGCFGTFGGTADFDPGPGTTALTSNGNSDLFLASYDASGALRFAFSLGNTNPVEGRGVTVDATGTVHVAGTFRGGMDVDPGPDEVLIGNNDLHTLIASYTSEGAYRNAYFLGPLGGGDAQGRDIATDAAGRPHVIGTFSGTEDFDPGPGEVPLTSNGSGDVFVTSYEAMAVAAEGPAGATAPRLGAPYPNPAAGSGAVPFSLSEAGTVRIDVLDVLGRVVAVLADGPFPTGDHAVPVDVSDVLTGVYLVRLQAGGQALVRRWAVQR